MLELRAQNDEIREQNEGLSAALSALMLQRAKEEQIRHERDVALGALWGFVSERFCICRAGANMVIILK